MKKWILVASLVLLGALAFAACGGDDGDGNEESADDGNLPRVSGDAQDSGVGQYRVTVSFNEDAVQADLDVIGALLAGYDGDAEYLIQESFPPTGVATLITDAEDFCRTVVSSIEAEAFVTSALCGPQLEPGDAGFDDVMTGDLTDADCEPVELRSDCGIDPNVCNEVHNIDACTGEDDGETTSPGCELGTIDCNDTPDTDFGDDGDQPGIVVSPVCAPDFPDCVDMIVNVCESGECTGDNEESADDGNLPQVSDDALVPGFGQYQVTVSFNEDAVQADLDEIGALLAGYDGDAEYLIQESFPPTGVATLITDADDFCETVVSSLEAETFVTSASCGPQLEPGDVDGDDVTTTGELTDADCEPVELRSDCGIDPDVCNEVHNIDACTGEDDGDGPGIVASPVCAPDFPDCEDMIVNVCESGECTGDNEVEQDPPLARPDVRPGVENQYTITIRFNETVSADQLDEAGARIRDFDPDAEYVIQESFPPTGVANFGGETEDACLALVQGLETETFVTSVSCARS